MRCLIFAALVAHSDARHVLEPDHGVLHCAGQDANTFQAYTKFMAPDSAPSVFMTYTGLESFKKKGSGASWAKKLLKHLGNSTGSHFVVPQIGLSLPHGDDLHKVQSGEYDVAIAEVAKGLRALDRPAYVRVGFEFNGQWNNFPPGPYKPAFRRIVAPWKADPKLLGMVASIWDYSCDSLPERRNASQWYPGDDVVDWWGVNIFGGVSDNDPQGDSGPNASCVMDFVKEAQSRGFPVVLGESTPRSLVVLDSAGFQLQHADLCLDVDAGASGWSTANYSVDPGGKVVMSHCNSSRATQKWYHLSSAQLENGVGLCLTNEATKSGKYSETLDCDAGSDKVWTKNADGSLTNGHGMCLQPAKSLGGEVTVIGCTGQKDQVWQWNDDGKSDGHAKWQEWFQPYLSLMEAPAVKMACYIDWNWRKHSNHGSSNWYDWNDCRLESPDAKIIGGKWRAALNNSEVINRMSEEKFCAIVGCGSIGSAKKVQQTFV